MPKISKIIVRYCRKGHRNIFFPGGRCITCYYHYHKLKSLLKNIEKRREFLYLIWSRGLEQYYDFEYFVALDGTPVEGVELYGLAKLYKDAENLI